MALLAKYPLYKPEHLFNFPYLHKKAGMVTHVYNPSTLGVEIRRQIHSSASLECPVDKMLSFNLRILNFKSQALWKKTFSISALGRSAVVQPVLVPCCRGHLSWTDDAFGAVICTSQTAPGLILFVGMWMRKGLATQ